MKYTIFETICIIFIVDTISFFLLKWYWKH